MTIGEIASLVSSVGFPIVVAWYLLTRMDKTMKNNTDAINGLHVTLARICEKLNETGKGDIKIPPGS